MFNSWQTYAAAAVLFASLSLVIAGCWISDNEVTPPSEPTHVSKTVPSGETAPSNQEAPSDKTAPVGEATSANREEQSSEAIPAGETTPIERTEYGHSGGSPKTYVPAPLRLRIFEASAIVRAILISSSAAAVRYSAAGALDVDDDKIGVGDSREPVDGEYRAAHTFLFRVTEYLKGSGASEITVTARTFSTHGTEAQALQVATDWLGERDTSRDDHEAILFLWEPGSGGASTDAFHFLRSGPYHSLHYTIDTMNRVWLPAKDPPPAEGESSSYDDSSLLFLVGEPVVRGSPTPEPGSTTMSLAELRTEIEGVDALIEAGDGTEEYRECVGEVWRYEHFWQGEPRVPVEFVRQLTSGVSEGAEVQLFSGHEPRYSRILIEGVDKDLFKAVRIDDDDLPDNGYQFGVATARPLPAGIYQYKGYTQRYIYVPCNFFPYNSYIVKNVVVTAPVGTLHEMFFDPVTVGSTVASDGTNGVLKPPSFTDANGAAATINSISYESSTVKIGVSPDDALADQIVDIIELDGTVSLSLDVADATVDSANDTLSWTVESQPWDDGDQLMVRIRR